MTDKLIEAVAEAIANLSETYCKSFIEEARAAIAAIEASGTHRVVPTKPTEQMLAEGKAALVSFDMQHWGSKGICLFVYENMVDAAPKVTE